MSCFLYFRGAALAIPGGSTFGPAAANVPVYLRAVQCDGNEASIAACPYQGNWGVPNNACPHTQDAGVACLGDLISTTVSTTPRTTPTTIIPRICTSIKLYSKLSIYFIIRLLFNNNNHLFCQ